MTSALLAATGPDGARLTDDLRAVGVDVIDTADVASLLAATIRHAPDLIVCFENHPGDDLFSSTTALARSAPRPVVVFTSDPDAENIERAARSGVHAYVINGYGRHRLRSVIQVAQARFRHEQVLREELTEVNKRFAERKLVDRAKGILMGARRIREEEAFRALRSAAMNTKQRIGQVSRQIIEASRFAEAVNRAGQLRMLSQRLVKLYALLCAGITPAETAGIFTDSVDHVDRNLAILSRTISAATFGDLLESVVRPWTAMKAAIALPAEAGRLRSVDQCAETLLVQAERLTANLEIAAFATSLHVINVSGRQRMLSQRLAKLALFGALWGLGDVEAALGTAEREFGEGLAALRATPLVTPEITQLLDGAEANAAAFGARLQDVGTSASRTELARLSEVILGDFDQLTDAYERALQSLFA